MKMKIVAVACSLAWMPAWAGTTADALAIEYSRLLNGGSGGMTSKIWRAESSSGTCDISRCSSSRSLPNMPPVEDNSSCGIITVSNMNRCFEGLSLDTGDVKRYNTWWNHEVVRVVVSISNGVVTRSQYRGHNVPRYPGAWSTTRAGLKDAIAAGWVTQSGSGALFHTYDLCGGKATLGVTSMWGNRGNPSLASVSGVWEINSCGYSCFPAGALVLMADGSQQLIEHIMRGDVLMGADGNPVVVQDVDRPVLGDRRMMAMEDGSLFWSEEHACWTKDHSGKQWWWAANPERWRWEASIGHMGGLRDNATLRGGDGFAFAHLDGWKGLEVHEADGFGPETQLYLPRTNGVPIIVNGYVVGAGVNQDAFEYEEFDWDTCRHIVLEACFAEAV